MAGIGRFPPGCGRTGAWLRLPGRLPRMRGARNALIAAVLDIACVLVFVVIGRASHVKGEALAGIASTAWPFLGGLAAGWAAAAGLARRRAARPARGRPGPWPLAVRPAGIVIWLATVALGMILRVVSGQGTAAAFIVVALAFLGLFLLGWRLAWALVARRARPRDALAAGGRQAEAGTGP
jgi:hypothetical protein